MKRFYYCIRIIFCSVLQVKFVLIKMVYLWISNIQASLRSIEKIFGPLIFGLPNSQSLHFLNPNLESVIDFGSREERGDRKREGKKYWHGRDFFCSTFILIAHLEGIWIWFNSGKSWIFFFKDLRDILFSREDVRFKVEKENIF